jgi:hypothetical protein
MIRLVFEWFFVSFILLTNFYRYSKIDGPIVYVCLLETFEDYVFTKHFSLPYMILVL